MRRMPPRVRLRWGAWVGSRQAKAGAAACLAFVIVALAAPGPAAAYRCEDPPTPAQATGLSSNACPVPSEERPAHETKRGNISGLTVFVLAVAAVLLIPIGARGIPAAIDPYRRDRPYWD